MILDAKCSPSNIRHPQDFSLLNEAREKLDGMIDKLHAMVDEPHRPRTYRKVLRKAYLAMARSKRCPAKKMRSLVRVMLCAVKRNMAFVDAYLDKGLVLEDGRDVRNLDAMRRLYAQLREMFGEKRRRVDDRIVSIAQPFVRPIVRGKAKAPVEFGAKYDVSVDKNGHARLEKASFDAYNECTVLKDVVERYREADGRYPRRVLVDRVYRTRRGGTGRIARNGALRCPDGVPAGLRRTEGNGARPRKTRGRTTSTASRSSASSAATSAASARA